MSCNGCRVLRKGCSETCILRPCLQWIQSAESQGHATIFVAKFFGRAGLMSFISAVPEPHRPALFQSLLFEACGRTVNPVNGAVGMLWTGNWHVCQAAVETVLRGGSLRPIISDLPDLAVGESKSLISSDESSEICNNKQLHHHSRFSISRSKLFTTKIEESQLNRKRFKSDRSDSDLDLQLNHVLFSSPITSLNPSTPPLSSSICKAVIGDRPVSPSMISEESITTTSYWGNGSFEKNNGETKLLNLFV